LVIDVDKAISIWNHAFPSDRLKAADPAGMTAVAASEEAANKQSLNLLTGATYGSSFVGMVHVLQSETTDVGEGAGSGQSMTEVAESMQEKFKVAAWLESESGGLGADSDFVNDIKRLLGKQDFSTHVTLITMGIVPSIKSSELAAGVERFAKFDAKEMMDSLGNLSSPSATTSVAQKSKEAVNAKKLTELKGAQAQSVMLGLDEIDAKKNSMIDLNSLVTAFDDYLEKVSDGECGGVPITYFVKPITKAALAEMWLAKHRPDATSEETAKAEAKTAKSGR
jgi:hypothetical protein